MFYLKFTHKTILHNKVDREVKLKIGYLGPVWYMCLKTENCYLKTFVEIRVSEKVR